MQFPIQPQAADFKDRDVSLSWRDFANGETLDTRSLSRQAPWAIAGALSNKLSTYEKTIIEEALRASGGTVAVGPRIIRTTRVT